MSEFRNSPNFSSGSLSEIEGMVKCRYYLVRQVRHRTSLESAETKSNFDERSFTLQKKEISICEIKVPKNEPVTGLVPRLVKISEAGNTQETSKRKIDGAIPGEFHFNSTENQYDDNSIREAKLDEEDSVIECHSPTSNMINKAAFGESEESKHHRNVSEGLTEVNTIITSDDDSLIGPDNNNEHDVISIESDDDIEIVNVVKAPKNRLKEKRERAQTRHQQHYLDFVVPSERFEFSMPKLQMRFRPKQKPKSRRRCHSSIATNTKLKFPENSNESNKRPRAVSVTHEKTSSSDKDCRVETSLPRPRPPFIQNSQDRDLGGTSQERSTQDNKSRDEFDASMKEKCIPTQSPKLEASGSVQMDGFHEGKSSFCWKKNTIGRKSFSTKKHYNYSNTKEDAFLEQERLFREAASRVRSHTKVHVIQQHDHSIFSEPVTDISKLPDSHWKFKDPYSRLGLPENSKTDLVKKHFRRLALLYHPDKAKGIDTANQFQAIKEAYEVLMSRQG